MFLSINFMNTIQIKISYKIFHHNQTIPFATCTATEKKGVVRLNNWQIDEKLLSEQTQSGIVHDKTLSILRKETREAVKRFLTDTKFCFLWNEETCLEHYLKLS